VSDLYISTIGPPIFLQQKRHTDLGNIVIAHRKRNVGIGTITTLRRHNTENSKQIFPVLTEATQFPEKKYINGIFVASKY
jgi:hypothetical protein